MKEKSIKNKKTIKAPLELKEVPRRILEAYREIGLVTSGQISVLLPVLWKECQKPNVLGLRSIGQVMEINDFSIWFYKAVLYREPDRKFEHWIEPINKILATVQPIYDQRGHDDRTHRVIYAVLLFLLSPLFSLSDLIRLKGGWHLLCDGSSFYDLNIHQYLPRTQNEREGLLKLMDEIEEPCVRRMIIYYFGLAPLNPEKGPHQRRDISYGKGDVWAQNAQSEMYKRYPDLFENINFEYESQNEDLVKKMIAHIADTGQLSAMASSEDPILAKCAIDRWDKAIRHKDLAPDWSTVYDLARKKPELFYKVYEADLEIIALQWSSTNNKAKKKAIENIFRYISLDSTPYDNGMYKDSLPLINNYHEKGIASLNSMVQVDHDIFMELVRPYDIPSPRVPWLLFSKGIEPLIGLMWSYVVEGHSNSSKFTDYPVLTSAVLNLMLISYPERITELEPAVLGSILSNCTDTTLSTISQYILPVVFEHDSTATGLIAALSQLDSQQLKEQAWLFGTDESTCSLLIKKIIKNQTSQNFSLLEKLCNEENISQLDRDLCQDHLELKNKKVQQNTQRINHKSPSPQKQIYLDYGMKNGGWDIASGSVKYRIILSDDQSLRIISESGKMTKSIPKPRHDFDEDELSLAKKAFNDLKKNINIEVKTLRKNLYTHLASATLWNSDQWIKIYIAHPLKKQLTGGIIWSKLSVDGVFIESFRVNDDKFINFQGQEIILGSDNLVRIWHPIEDPETVREQWSLDIVQSNLTPIIIQTELPVVVISEKQRSKLVSYQYQGYAMTISDFKKFRSLFQFDPWGGDKGCNSTFNFRILGGSGKLAISLQTSSIDSYMEKNEKVYLFFSEILDRSFKTGLLSIEDVSPITIAMFYSILEQFSQKSMGYQKNWVNAL